MSIGDLNNSCVRPRTFIILDCRIDRTSWSVDKIFLIDKLDIVNIVFHEWPETELRSLFTILGTRNTNSPQNGTESHKSTSVLRLTLNIVLMNCSCSAPSKYFRFKYLVKRANICSSILSTMRISLGMLCRWAELMRTSICCLEHEQLNRRQERRNFNFHRSGENSKQTSLEINHDRAVKYFCRSIKGEAIHDNQIKSVSHNLYNAIGRSRGNKFGDKL